VIILIIASILYIPTLILAAFYFPFSYKASCKTANDARYNLYKEIDLIIAADYHYLFNKSHEALRSMKLKIVEINEEEGSLEANKFLTWNIPGTLKIRIVKVENNEKSYQIKFDYRQFLSDPINLLERSRLINRFIDILLSKPKNVDAKSNSKIDELTDIGD